MSDSVYVAITANRFDPNLTTVLFLRRSNGQWWLPGGRILPQHVTSTKAIEYWVEKLLPLDDLSAEETGRWCLSQEAGGHEVRLFEKNMDRPTLRPRYFSSGLSQSWAWFTIYGIQSALYRNKTMPWGQAKMALYAIYNLHFTDERAINDPLKDSLGNHGTLIWNRPT